MQKHDHFASKALQEIYAITKCLNLIEVFEHDVGALFKAAVRAWNFNYFDGYQN